MSDRTKNKPTQEYIDALIKKYSDREKVLDFLYVGPSSTPIRLQSFMENGITLNSLARSLFDIVTLPEFRSGEFPSNTVKAWDEQTKLVKVILSNFINASPDYFRKVSKTKYAVKEKFILDVLFHNKEKGIDALDIQGIFNYIIDFDNFSKLVETFYIPSHNDETPFTLRLKFREVRPYKYSKRAGG